MNKFSSDPLFDSSNQEGGLPSWCTHSNLGDQATDMHRMEDLIADTQMDFSSLQSSGSFDSNLSANRSNRIPIANQFDANPRINQLNPTTSPNIQFFHNLETWPLQGAPQSANQFNPRPGTQVPLDQNLSQYDSDTAIPQTIGMTFIEKVKALQKEFALNPDPSHEVVQRLANLINVPADQIFGWFQIERSHRMPLGQRHGLITPDTTKSVEPPKFESRQYSSDQSQSLSRNLNSDDSIENSLPSGTSPKRLLTPDDTRIADPKDTNSGRPPKKRLCVTEKGCFPCQMCQKTSDNIKDWRDHQKRVHFPKTVFICGLKKGGKLCAVSPFKRPDNAKQHLKDKHGLRSKEAIDAEFNKRQIEVNNLFHDRCGFCRKKLHTWQESMDHIADHIANDIGAKSVPKWSHCCETDHELKAGVHYNFPPEVIQGDDDQDGDNTDASKNNGDSSGSRDENYGPGSFDSDHQDEGTSRESGGRLGTGSASYRTKRWLLHTEKRRPSLDHTTPTKVDCESLEMSSPVYLNIVRKLGSGGSGDVHEVSCGLFKQKFVLKTIRGRQFGSSRTTAEVVFKNEVEILKSLRHPHIVQLLHSYTFRDCFNILMQPVADCDLTQFMQRSEQTSTIDGMEKLHRCRNVYQWMSCLASAVKYLHSGHSKPTWHLDIKPKNILIQGKAIVLTDFGLAKTVSSSLASKSSRQVTAMTPNYAPPEIFERGRGWSASDIFSLGCVFSEMMTFLVDGTGEALDKFKVFRSAGQKDHSFHRTISKAKDWIAMLENECNLERSPLSSYALPFDIVGRMLSRNPEDRPTAHEVWLRFPQYDCCSSFNKNSEDAPPSSATPPASTRYPNEQGTRNAQGVRKKSMASEVSPIDTCQRANVDKKPFDCRKYLSGRVTDSHRFNEIGRTKRPLVFLDTGANKK